VGGFWRALLRGFLLFVVLPVVVVAQMVLTPLATMIALTGEPLPPEGRPWFAVLCSGLAILSTIETLLLLRACAPRADSFNRDELARGRTLEPGLVVLSGEVVRVDDDALWLDVDGLAVRVDGELWGPDSLVGRRVWVRGVLSPPQSLPSQEDEGPFRSSAPSTSPYVLRSGTLSFEPPIDFALADKLARAAKITASFGVACAALPWLLDGRFVGLTPMAMIVPPVFALRQCDKFAIRA
jgi:hypothetical protein